MAKHDWMYKHSRLDMTHLSDAEEMAFAAMSPECVGMQRLITEINTLNHMLVDPNYMFDGVRIHRQQLVGRTIEIRQLRAEVEELKKGGLVDARLEAANERLVAVELTLTQNKAHWDKMEIELVHLRGEEHRLHKHISKQDALLGKLDDCGGTPELGRKYGELHGVAPMKGTMGSVWFRGDTNKGSILETMVFFSFAGWSAMEHHSVNEDEAWSALGRGLRNMRDRVCMVKEKQDIPF